MGSNFVKDYSFNDQEFNFKWFINIIFFIKNWKINIKNVILNLFIDLSFILGNVKFI